MINYENIISELEKTEEINQVALTNEMKNVE
jgi:hypothetical protein